jgi:hypothetical protein
MQQTAPPVNKFSQMAQAQAQIDHPSRLDAAAAAVASKLEELIITVEPPPVGSAAEEFARYVESCVKRGQPSCRIPQGIVERVLPVYLPYGPPHERAGNPNTHIEVGGEHVPTVAAVFGLKPRGSQPAVAVPNGGAVERVNKRFDEIADYDGCLLEASIRPCKSTWIDSNGVKRYHHTIVFTFVWDKGAHAKWLKEREDQQWQRAEHPRQREGRRQWQRPQPEGRQDQS